MFTIFYLDSSVQARRPHHSLQQAIATTVVQASSVRFGDRLRFPMGGHTNILATAYGRRDASEERSHDYGEGNPENQLRDKEQSGDISSRSWFPGIPAARRRSGCPNFPGWRKTSR